MKDLIILYNTDMQKFTSMLLDELTFINNSHKSFKNLEDYISILTTSIYYDSFNRGIKGHIYALDHNSFKSHGDHIYKLGCTDNLKHRIGQYYTAHLTRPTYKAESKILNNYAFAEMILFELLSQHRMFTRKEFFDCPLDTIKETFTKIEQMFEIKENRIMLGGVYNAIKQNIVRGLINYTVKNDIQHDLNGLLNTKLQREIITGLKVADINMLLEVQNETKSYDDISKKLVKTNRDKYIMDAYAIKNIFCLTTLSYTFLEDLAHADNIDKYCKSLVYFANSTYRDDYTIKRSYTLSVKSAELPIKQANMISAVAALFWDNGLLDDETIKAFSSKETNKVNSDKNMTKEQKEFIGSNIDTMRKLFESIKRKETPETQYQFIKWLDSIIGEFFGPFVRLVISKQYKVRGDKKQYCYYKVSIDIAKYLELILLKNKTVIDRKYIDIIQNIFGHTKCSYKDIHKFKRLIDIYNNA